MYVKCVSSVQTLLFNHPVKSSLAHIPFSGRRTDDDSPVPTVLYNNFDLMNDRLQCFKAVFLHFACKFQRVRIGNILTDLAFIW